MNGDPVNFVDPDGEFAVAAALAIWAGVEVGLSIYDAYNTGTTLLDPVHLPKKASNWWSILAGIILPGGGYTAGGKAGYKQGMETGDDVYNLTAKGESTILTTVRTRFWKNESALPARRRNTGRKLRENGERKGTAKIQR